MSGEMEIKDRRRAPWFYIDNHVLDKYAKRVGVTAWAIYTTICRLANEKVYEDGTRRRNRKISVNGLASMWGISRATVKRATSVLRKEQLIRVTKRQGVSDVEILSVEQLNFDDKLNFSRLTSEPSKTVSDGSPLIPPKAHTRSLPGLTGEPHSKPIDTKPSSSKPSGVDAGFKPLASTKKNRPSSPGPTTAHFQAELKKGLQKILPSIDAGAVHQIWTYCTANAPGCTVDDVLDWAHSKEFYLPKALNPTGFLIHAIEVCATPEGLQELKQERQMEEHARRARKHRQEQLDEESRAAVERYKREEEAVSRAAVEVEKWPEAKKEPLRKEALQKLAENMPHYRQIWSPKMIDEHVNRIVVQKVAKSMEEKRRKKA